MEIVGQAIQHLAAAHHDRDRAVRHDEELLVLERDLDRCLVEGQRVVASCKEPVPSLRLCVARRRSFEQRPGPPGTRRRRGRGQNRAGAIGIHLAKLRPRAVAIGEVIGLCRIWPVSKCCIPPFGPAWTAAIANRRGGSLAREFKIEGFPTIVFLDAKGKEVGRSGYVKGGPAAWIAAAEKELGIKSGKKK